MYEAQIYNYGKRLMFEFIVPEPAAFFAYAQNHPKSTNNLAAPPSLGSVTHKDINVNNYQTYIRDYGVQGVTPPPPQFRTISATVAKDGLPFDGNAHTTTTKDLVVPKDYVSKVGIWWDMSVIWSHYPIVEVTIGNKIFRPLEYPVGPARTMNFDSRFAMGNAHDDNTIPFHWFWPDTPIQVSVNCYDISSFTMNVYALVELTNEAYEQWQIQTFEKIVASYQALKSVYDRQVAQTQVQQGVAIHGQNPLINREIEKNELKKSCVKLLMDSWQFGSFSAMKQVGDAPPDFDLLQAVSEGKSTQFFEQAFEWENITYLFYPYFWGRQNQWIQKVTTFDEDPLFTKFLQSGSARVVVPVHPAYNDAVMYFLENGGAIWNGGEPPRLNDPLFISLADELRDQTDDLANATPEDDPWQVILPTTLVYLQKDAELPAFA
jgi:hypothetical protein